MPRALTKATLTRAREKFLVTVAATGQITKAAKAAGISRETFYGWRREDEEFAKQWDAALEIAADMLEDVAIERATTGVLKPVFQGGVKVGTVREYSDQLLALLLKAHKPTKFRERAQVDVSNEDGSLQPLDDTARSARVAQLMALAQRREAAGEKPGGES